MTVWFIKNQILITVIFAWASAQLIKTFLYFKIEGEFRAERLVGSGGMPSSHSSTVCALCVSAFCIYGIHSFEFAISFVLALIVMHDAMNVRLETGKQAKIINAIIQNPMFDFSGKAFEQNLKELIGHTPLQVVCGAILGITEAALLQLIVFNLSK